MNQNATLTTTDVTGWRLRLLHSIHRHPKLHTVLLLIIGASATLSFAPYYFWPSYILGVAYLFLACHHSTKPKQALGFGFSFALGMFGSGVSWIYVSIANFGQVGLEVAVGITFGLIAAASLYWALAGYSYRKLQPRLPARFHAPLFIILLLGFEWLRSTLFTGFPWLLPGYITENSWLFEWLPIGGIWLVSALCLLTTVSLAYALIMKNQYRWFIASCLAWIIAGGLNYFPPNYVTETSTHQITMVQGNVAQDEKWLIENAASTLGYYQQATINNMDSEIVIWPETAITYLLDQVEPYFGPFNEELVKHGTTLITGVPVWDENKDTYYNSVWATGNGFGLYEKQKLVPFGEYVPLASWFGPIFDLFGMPMSQFSKGPTNQPTLQAGELSIAPFICYEVVYPELVRNMVRGSDLLLTISNDGWFGHSIGPLQHLQIAQFRAKEAGRYMIRATNTGVSAIINENGQIASELPQFTRATLTGTVNTYTGYTPYVMYGNLALWILLALLIGVASLPVRANSNTSQHQNENGSADHSLS